jgi:hypothetical protein
VVLLLESERRRLESESLFIEPEQLLRDTTAPCRVKLAAFTSLIGKKATSSRGRGRPGLVFWLKPEARSLIAELRGLHAAIGSAQMAVP